MEDFLSQLQKIFTNYQTDTGLLSFIYVKVGSRWMSIRVGYAVSVYEYAHYGHKPKRTCA